VGAVVTGLAQNTAYEFRVRQCDVATCSPYSNTVSATAGGASGDQIQLYIDSLTTANWLQSSALLNDGFTASITIPEGTCSGQHMIYAVLGTVPQSSQSSGLQLAAGGTRFAGPLTAQPANAQPTPSPSAIQPGNALPIARNGQLAGPIGNLDCQVGTSPASLGAESASAPITVVAAGQSLPPAIWVTDWPSLAGKAVRVSIGSPISLSGQGFQPGRVTITVGAGGNTAGAVTVNSDKTSFQTSASPPGGQWPCGDFTLVASEMMNGQTLTASQPVTGECSH
jgi:hypothetical protein